MNMKKSVIVLMAAAAVVMTGAGNAFSTDIAAESEIREVTVFPDSAIVSRVAKLELPAGEHRVIFSGIVPEITENSVRAYAAGGAEYKLHGAQVEKQYLEDAAAENVKRLKDEIEKVEDEIKMQDYISATLKSDREFIESISLYSKDQMPKELLTKIPQVSELDGILKFIDSKYRDNYALVIEGDRKSRELNRKLGALRSELDQISGNAKKTKSSIVVTLDVTKPGALELKISYGVNQASWQPVYDARADLEANKIELVSYAVVKQTTGEEWADARMTMSTAKPDIGGRLPEIKPWFLKPFMPPRPAQEWATTGRAMAKSAALLESRDMDLMRDEVNIVAAPAKEVYAAPKETGIAVSYILPQPATIKSDGTDHRFPISTQSLDAEFSYSAYPRVSNSAYLGSKVENAKGLQLLAGVVSIFFQGDYVGTSSIDNIGPGEKFDLYLGADENVKVKREQVSKKVDDVWVANIPSPNKTTVFTYKITAENYKQKKIKLNIFDSMPVSEADKIKVKIDAVRPEATEMDWKGRKGVWRWELGLEPKDKKEIVYTFSVENPRDLIVEGL